MEHSDPKCMAMELLVLGVILIVVRTYTNWDIWVVVGALLVLKALWIYFNPMCGCARKK